MGRIRDELAKNVKKKKDAKGITKYSCCLNALFNYLGLDNSNQRIVSFIQRVVQMILFNIYPDCPTYRLENALELYKLILSVCKSLDFVCAHQQIFPYSSLSQFGADGSSLNIYTEQAVKIILATLWTEYEKDRNLALGIHRLLRTILNIN